MKLAVIGGSREASVLEAAAQKSGIEIDAAGEVTVIAAHPFDTDLWECAALSAANHPHIGLVRPSWEPKATDHWQFANSASQAAEMLGNSGAKRALLAVGNARLMPFYQLQNIELCVRSRNAPHPPNPPRGKISTMRGPFDITSETLELQQNGIDILVVHNAGGQGGWPKLGAARALGLPVILISRPKLPEMKMVETVEQALIWVKRHMGLDEGGQSA